MVLANINRLLNTPTALLCGLLAGFAAASVFPWRISALLIVLMLAAYVATYPAMFGLVSQSAYETSIRGVMNGRYTAQFPNSDGSMPQGGSEEGVVIFMIGAQSNHPAGLAYPEFIKITKLFRDLWKDVESRSKEWGYLGRTMTTSTVPQQPNTFITYSHWRNLAGLHEFAHSEGHKAAWKYWEENTAKLKYIGVFHEVYVVPKKSYENIYLNYRPWGFGNLEIQTDVGTKSTLIKAKGSHLTTMLKRMGRDDA